MDRAYAIAAAVALTVLILALAIVEAIGGNP